VILPAGFCVCDDQIASVRRNHGGRFGSANRLPPPAAVALGITGMGQNGTKFPWTKDRECAAILLAEDELSDDEIASQVGISRSTLSRWKEREAFQTRIAEHAAHINAAMLRLAIAKRHKRVQVLDDLHTKLLTITEERAGEYARLAEEQASESEAQQVFRQMFGGRGEIPAGAGTGLIVRQLKQIGAGKTAQVVEEFAVDTGLIRELRALHEQAAKELGQWEETTNVKGELLVRRYIGVNPEDV
jgi:hypothetical protein